MSKGAKLALALCLLAAAGLLAAASLPPGWISWQEKQLPRQSGQPALMLRDKALWAELDGEWTRQTGPELLVQDVLRCDIDRDGAPELLLLCWKRGRYGQSRPFWVEEDPPGWSSCSFRQPAPAPLTGADTAKEAPGASAPGASRFFL